MRVDFALHDKQVGSEVTRNTIVAMQTDLNYTGSSVGMCGKGKDRLQRIAWESWRQEGFRICVLNNAQVSQRLSQCHAEH